MMNYPVQIWHSLKKGCFPGVHGEIEKKLKLAFLQGMHTGKELVIQSTKLKNDELADFHRNLRQQIEGELAQIGHKPGKVLIHTVEVDKPKIVGTDGN